MWRFNWKEICKMAFWGLILLITLPLSYKYAILVLRMLLMKEVHCPACGYVIDPVGYWRCSCGFSAPRERHVLAPCEKCGKVFNWIQCPACEMSISI